MHGFSHNLSGCNVFVLRLGTLFGIKLFFAL